MDRERDYQLRCCGGPNPQSWGPGTLRHLPECEHFKAVAQVSLSLSSTGSKNLHKSIGDGSIFKTVIVQCNNGVTVEVYPDGSVKQTQHDGSFQLTGLPRKAV